MTDSGVRRGAALLLHRIRTPRAWLAVLVVTGVVLAGCEPPRDEPDRTVAGGSRDEPESGACPKAGRLTGARLPTFDSDRYVTVDNPCIPYAGLVSEVIGMIPAAERTGAGRATEFVGRLDRFVNRLSVVNDVAECAYRTDRLAVRIHQSRQDRWAVGITAVVRGRLGAVAETTACALIQQIASLGLGVRDDGPERDSPAFCFNTSRDRRSGEDYTVMWIGSSSKVCRQLNEQLVPGDGHLVVIEAEPDVALRSGPSQDDEVLRRVPDGTLGRVGCYRTGEPTDGTELWGRVEILGETGFVSAAYLDDPLLLGRPEECPGG
ncbi:SH3 domain-containing protein [Plantactinospora mayteni]|nr:SH3 domain-containing protein [Plantactinospora mayteni]